MCTPGEMADQARPAIERCLEEKALHVPRGIQKCSADKIQHGAACNANGLRCALPPELSVHRMTMRHFWDATAHYNNSSSDTSEKLLYGTHRIEGDFETDLIRRDLRGLR